jgi:hypothetical protein
MVAKVFDDILLKGIRSGQMPARTQEARKWYRDQAATVTKKQAEGTRLIKEMGRDRYENRFRLGNMYTFMYDPKHKADKSKLPYYDNYPLIFPINKAKGGFLGINLHYLPPVLRAKLMDALYDTANNKSYTEATKLKINYDILSGAAKFNMFKPTVKHYLMSQVRTKFVYIQPTEWDIALFLPSQKFVGATKAQVWKDSRAIIKGR